MKVKCPVCKKEKDIDFGKYICSNCNSKFEFQTDRRVKLIKRNKFDYWTLFFALMFPLMFITLFAISIFQDELHRFFVIPIGIFMVLYPVPIIIRQYFDHGYNAVTLLDLYIRFFKRELIKEDNGRQIGFYLTFITNVLGVILIFIKLIIK